MIKLYESVGQRIRRLRKAMGLTQSGLAEACGWASQSRVGNYESGTREPSLGDLALIAKALQIEFTDLVQMVPLDDGLGSTKTAGKAIMLLEKADQAPAASSADLVARMLEKHGKGLSAAARQRIADAAQETVSVITSSGNVINADFSRPGPVGDEIRIAHYDIKASMGDGGKLPPDYPEVLRDMTVSMKHLRDLGLEFEDYNYLKIVNGWGQSMAPTIKHRDPLIVDISIREFVGDGVYLLVWDDLLYIKRLQAADAEHYEMLSDNPTHKDRVILRDDIHIQARVLMVWNAQLL